LPKWLQRSPKSSALAENLGTSFHVLGFNGADGWKDQLIVSVLENFFGAIWRAKLSVEVGKELISKETLQELLGRPGLAESVKDMKDEPEAFNNARDFLKALAGGEEVLVENQENRELGNCEVRIIVGDNLPKRVAALRNGMFITDQMEHLKRFGDFKEFVAVVECHNRKGNELLRDMEPPRHDDFQPERLPTADRAKGKRALSELARWVREMLKRHATDPVSDVTEVRELADYFADEFGEGDSNTKGDEVNPVGAIQIRAQPLKRRPVVVKEEDEGEDGGAAEGDSGRGGGNGGGSGSGGGSGGTGKSSLRTVELHNVRSVVISPKGRRVAFTPTFTGKMDLTVYEAGADTDRRLTVAYCTPGVPRQGTIRNLAAKRGVRMSVEIGLEANFFGAMKVAAHEV
jgi:hypothetical protein